MKLRLIPVLIAVILAGCSDHDRTPKESEKYNTPLTGTSAGRIVEDMAGATAVKSGRKAQETIKKVAAQENAALNEVMEK